MALQKLALLILLLCDEDGVTIIVGISIAFESVCLLNVCNLQYIVS
jgi:hypothetical protein